MGTKILELGDGVFVEIDDPGGQKVEMHTSEAKQVDTTMKRVGDMMSKIIKPIGDALGGLRATLNVPIEVATAEVELGLTFSAEGNLFIAKSKAEGTLKVKVGFRPVEPAVPPPPVANPPAALPAQPLAGMGS